MPSAAATVPVPSDLQNIPQSTGRSPATQNALDFVRALKAPTDPPHLLGPTKIEIAQAAWNNNSFYMPNKAETIVEWIMTRFLKDKAKDPCVNPLGASEILSLIALYSAANPILDVQYWALLEGVLFVQSDVQIRDKAWLAPLLSRIPIAPIAVSLLSLYSRQDVMMAPALEPKACRCLSALWSLAVPKFSSEALLECFGTLLDYLCSHDATEIAICEGFLTQLA